MDNQNGKCGKEKQEDILKDVEKQKWEDMEKKIFHLFAKESSDLLDHAHKVIFHVFVPLKAMGMDPFLHNQQ